jgi:hypothetical protein
MPYKNEAKRRAYKKAWDAAHRIRNPKPVRRVSHVRKSETRNHETRNLGKPLGNPESNGRVSETQAKPETRKPKTWEQIAQEFIARAAELDLSEGSPADRARSQAKAKAKRDREEDRRMDREEAAYRAELPSSPPAKEEPPALDAEEVPVIDAEEVSAIDAEYV